MSKTAQEKSTQQSHLLQLAVRLRKRFTDAASVVHLRTTTEAEQSHLQVYEALGLSSEIL